jgi:hypothetical protein
MDFKRSNRLTFASARVCEDWESWWNQNIASWNPLISWLVQVEALMRSTG